MENLTQLLDKLLDTLHSLGAVQQEEYSLLCSAPIAGAALQRITENKNQLLTVVSLLEKHRLQIEQKQHFQAPYTDHPALFARWQDVQQLGKALQTQNHQHGLLLNHHIEHNARALSLLKKQNTSLYGPDGQSRANHVLGRKIGI